MSSVPGMTKCLSWQNHRQSRTKASHQFTTAHKAYAVRAPLQKEEQPLTYRTNRPRRMPNTTRAVIFLEEYSTAGFVGIVHQPEAPASVDDSGRIIEDSLHGVPGHQEHKEGEDCAGYD